MGVIIMFRSFVLCCCASLCIATAATATPKDIASECYLLELAYKVTKARKNTAFSDILVDCPGYENWTFEIRPGRTASHFAKR